MKECPFCGGTIERDLQVCQLCGRDLPVSNARVKSIFYCPICDTEDTYCDSTNRIFCPHCRNYVKDQE